MTKTIKWSTIISKSKEIKKNVEENQKIKLFSGCNTADTIYILSQAVKKPGKDVTLKRNYANCKEPTGTGINEKLSKTEYLNVATRIINFMDDSKNEYKSPNYIKFGSELISLRLAVYCFSKIVVWYNNHNKTLPSECLFKNKVFYKETIKKHGRSTKTGCDNRGQNNGYFCGPHMAQEIVRNLTGVVIPQSKIAAIMGTTSSGTGHSGIDTFFAWFNKNYSYTLQWSWKNFSDLGWSGLKKILESDDQDAGEHELYRGTWGHYTNFDKIYENSVDVHNSLGNYCSGSCYCGYTENRSKSEARSYLNGISQKSILVVKRVK